MIRGKYLFIALLFLACLAAANQTVRSQQYATTTVTSIVTSNQVSTLAVGTQVVTTTSGQTIPVISSTVPIPGTHGVCGIYFPQVFNGTAGDAFAGSVATNSSVDVYVMTSTVYQAWSHQIVAGGICTPSSLIASQLNTMAYNFTVTLPSTGVYFIVVDNLSQGGVSAKITAALTTSAPTVATIVQYSTVTQAMIQTLMEASIQTLQSTTQPSNIGSSTTTLAAVAVVIAIIVAVAAYLVKSKHSNAGKR